MTLSGKVAIVSGAASGIGRAVALMAAQEGATVLIADLDKDGGQAVEDEIVSSGGSAIAYTADMSEESAVEDLVRSAQERFGRLDILHNNIASVGASGLTRADNDLVAMDRLVWDRTMEINLRGPMLAAKHAIPVMLVGVQ